LDSTVALFWAAKNYGEPQHALSFEYDQRCIFELACVRRIVSRAPVQSHVFAHIGGRGVGLSGALVDRETKLVADEPDGGAFLPGRNVLFLTLAAARATMLGVSSIVIGANADDAAGFPDCRIDALLAIQAALSLSFGRELTVVVPFIADTKAAVVRRARSLGDDCWRAVGETWSCYEGRHIRREDARPCGACRACLVRAEAFRLAGETDPAVWT
jgi:7-cyano-7-deazaguanine synthase